MSFDAVAKKEFDKLSDAQQSTIVQLMVLFNQNNDKAEKHTKNNVPFNAFAGGLHYIADDCDIVQTLPGIHKDPFDRLIVSQAMADRMTIITKDGYIPQYEVKTVWD